MSFINLHLFDLMQIMPLVTRRNVGTENTAPITAVVLLLILLIGICYQVRKAWLKNKSDLGNSSNIKRPTKPVKINKNHATFAEAWKQGGEKILRENTYSIPSIYIAGINDFTENSRTTLETTPKEFCVVEVNSNKPKKLLHTASLPYAKIIHAGVFYVEELANIDFLENIVLSPSKLYFAIRYIDESGKLKHWIFEYQHKAMKYGMFIFVLEQRISSFLK